MKNFINTNINIPLLKRFKILTNYVINSLSMSKIKDLMQYFSRDNDKGILCANLKLLKELSMGFYM